MKQHLAAVEADTIRNDSSQPGTLRGFRTTPASARSGRHADMSRTMPTAVWFGLSPSSCITNFMSHHREGFQVVSLTSGIEKASRHIAHLGNDLEHEGPVTRAVRSASKAARMHD